MKKETKQKILKNEIANNIKKKKTTIKTKIKKIRDYTKTNSICFDLSKCLISLQASYAKTLNLSDNLKQFKKDNKTTILNNSNLTQEQKQQLLIYKNNTIINLKDVDKNLKNDFKNYCLTILKDNLKDSKNIDKTTLFLTEDDKSELTSFAKNILHIDYNFTYAMLKNALLSGYNNKMTLLK